jgi:hypothetical protein
MKFEILCSETTCYRVTVEADSEDAARELVTSGEVDIGEPYDGDNFAIDHVQEIQ